MSLLLRAFLVDADPSSAWSSIFFTSVSADPKPPKQQAGTAKHVKSPAEPQPETG
jgi:hypothetical protein